MSLSALATSCLEAACQARFAHVHVTGPGFVGLHALYKDIYGAMEDAFDRLAERVRALGSTLESEKLWCEADVGNQISCMVEALDALNIQLNDVRKNLDDPCTEAILDDIKEQVEKFIWQLEAHK
jgi:DNA-binding ferritin-like protein